MKPVKITDLPKHMQNQALNKMGSRPKTLSSITLLGQVRGGKNNMGVSRTGQHFPKPAWKAWRDDAVRQVVAQLPANWQPIDQPAPIRMDYYAGDKRRRDQPAIIDAVFHVLERAGVVTDDTLLWVVASTRNYDKEQPRVTIRFLP